MTKENKEKVKEKVGNELLCLTTLFTAYYQSFGNTDVALQNAQHTLNLLKKVSKS